MKVLCVFPVMALALSLCNSLNAQQVVVTQHGSHNSVAPASPLLKRIDVHYQNVSLASAIDDIASRAGVRTTYINQVVARHRVTFSGTGVTVSDAFAGILGHTNLELRSVNGQWLVSERLGAASRKPSGIIAGKVVDARTEKGVSGARVFFDNDTRGAVTGEDGSFRITDLSPGIHTLSVRLVGYAKQLRSVSVGEGATVTADFRLEPSANVLDQVVVTGSVIATAQKAVANPITVITGRQLEERGIQNIEQLFRGSVPGLFASNTGVTFTAFQSSTFARGASRVPPDAAAVTLNANPPSNPLKTYVDGVELVDPLLVNAIDPKTIDRIEIITGPQASTIYGSDAISGVMQVFTRRGSQASAPRFTATLMSGTIENNFTSNTAPQHDYSINTEGASGRINYAVGGGWAYEGAWVPLYHKETFSGHGGGRFEKGPLVLDGTARLLQRELLGRSSSTMAAVINNRKRKTGEYLANPFDAGIDAMVYKQPIQTLALNVAYSPTGWWHHQAVVGSDAQNAESIRSHPLLRMQTDTLRYFNKVDRERHSRSYTTTLRSTPAQNLQLTLSGGLDAWDLSYSQVTANPLNLTGSLPSPSITRKKDKNRGYFGQLQTGIYDVLFLTAGLRAERNPNYGSEFGTSYSPKFGLSAVRDIGAVTVKLRSSVGRATRPPTPEAKLPFFVKNDEFFGSFQSQFANPDLGPEFQRGSDGGIELYWGSRASLIVTRYDQTVDGLTIPVTLDSVPSIIPEFANFYEYQNQNQNLGQIRNDGWEVQTSTNIGPFTFDGTYTRSRSKVVALGLRYTGNIKVGDQVASIPSYVAGLNLRYSTRGTNVILSTSTVGPLHRIYSTLRYDISDARLNDDKPRMVYPSLRLYAVTSPYTTADLNVTRTFTRRVDGLFRVANLGNLYKNDISPEFPVMGRRTCVGVKLTTSH